MILEIDDEPGLAYELKEAYRIFSDSSASERAEEEIKISYPHFQMIKQLPKIQEKDDLLFK